MKIKDTEIRSVEEKNIGRKVRFKEPGCLVQNHEHEIIGIGYDFYGRKSYLVRVIPFGFYNTVYIYKGRKCVGERSEWKMTNFPEVLGECLVQPYHIEFNDLG